jgi:predicted MFS family arabinose efflux permease
VGRPTVYALGFFFLALGFGLSSYATSYLALVMYRLIYALGAAAAAAMLTTVMADYVAYKDKGTASGYVPQAHTRQRPT